MNNTFVKKPSRLKLSEKNKNEAAEFYKQIDAALETAPIEESISRLKALKCRQPSGDLWFLKRYATHVYENVYERHLRKLAEDARVKNDIRTLKSLYYMAKAEKLENAVKFIKHSINEIVRIVNAGIHTSITPTELFNMICDVGFAEILNSEHVGETLKKALELEEKSSL